MNSNCCKVDLSGSVNKEKELLNADLQQALECQ
jgi:hypothetical protein